MCMLSVQRSLQLWSSPRKRGYAQPNQAGVQPKDMAQSSDDICWSIRIHFSLSSASTARMIQFIFMGAVWLYHIFSTDEISPHDDVRAAPFQARHSLCYSPRALWRYETPKCASARENSSHQVAQSGKSMSCEGSRTEVTTLIPRDSLMRLTSSRASDRLTSNDWQPEVTQTRLSFSPCPLQHTRSASMQIRTKPRPATIRHKALVFYFISAQPPCKSYRQIYKRRDQYNMRGHRLHSQT